MLRDQSQAGGGFRLFDETFGDYALSGREWLPEAASDTADLPLIIAIPGGSYTSAYFDVPGYSLVERAGALNLPIIALDRPGYVGSTPLPPHEATIARNAERLDSAIGEFWARRRKPARGVVLIGHSIGGAITVSIAARGPAWPLLGIAVSGVGLVTPSESGEAWAALPNTPTVVLPPVIKEHVMFGPPWTLAGDMPARSRAADAPVPRAELIDITGRWQQVVRELAAQVRVPVHYRQAAFDRLWVVDQDQVRGFGAAFGAAPWVDAALFANAGHCIDFHRLGAAFQLEQLAFALKCCVQSEG